MTTLRSRFGVLIGSALMLAALPTPVFAEQDLIARVKDYYANASYEEALQTLRSAPPPGPDAGVSDVAAYQVFCLVALGREKEATDAIAAIVQVDPLYHPPETDVSPRIRSFYENVRKPLLPAIVRQLYASAKERLDRKEYAGAKKDLDRVIALLDEMKGSGDQDLGDLRTLALGFRDLALIAAAREAAPPPPPPPVAPTPVVQPVTLRTPPKEAIVYSPVDKDVTAPVVVARALPPWRAVSQVERLQSFRGQLELLIDENGKVLSTKMLKPLRPDYDPVLMKSAMSWTFRPATRDGKPVRYRYLMDMQLGGNQN
jgi:hypothetical protein